MLFCQIMISAALLASGSAKLKIEADGMLVKCDPKADTPGAIEPNLEFIMDDDDNLYVNGTYLFHREIKKWPVKFYTMKLSEGNWISGPFQRTVNDFCKSIHSPIEIWYPLFKTFNGCPIKKGVRRSFTHKLLN